MITVIINNDQEQQCSTTFSPLVPNSAANGHVPGNGCFIDRGLHKYTTIPYNCNLLKHQLQSSEMQTEAGQTLRKVGRLELEEVNCEYQERNR